MLRCIRDDIQVKIVIIELLQLREEHISAVRGPYDDLGTVDIHNGM